MKNNLIKLRNNFLREAHLLSKNCEGDCLDSLISILNYAYSISEKPLSNQPAYNIINTYLDSYFKKLDEINPNLSYKKFKTEDLMNGQIFSINSIKQNLVRKISEINTNYNF